MYVDLFHPLLSKILREVILKTASFCKKLNSKDIFGGRVTIDARLPVTSIKQKMYLIKNSAASSTFLIENSTTTNEDNNYNHAITTLIIGTT